MLQYLAKNMVLIVQNFLEIFFCRIPFSAILRLKKSSFGSKGGGGGGGGNFNVYDFPTVEKKIDLTTVRI